MEYRIYLQNADGHIERAEPFEGDSDEAAVLFAQSLDDPRPREVWESARRVSIFIPQTAANRN